MSEKTRAGDDIEPCGECGGRTIEFSGRGLDMQYRICSRYAEPGHKTKAECVEELGAMARAVRPSGRYA